MTTCTINRLPLARYCAVLVIAAAAIPAAARWAMYPAVPVSRLLKNIGEFVKAHPDDADAHYRLGRVESAAFAQKTGLRFRSEDGNAVMSVGEAPQGDHRKDVSKPTAKDLAMLGGSIHDYKRAVDLDTKTGLYHFGLAFEIEEAIACPASYSIAEHQLGLGTPPTLSDAERAEALRKQAIKEYRKAYDLTLDEDLTPRLGPVFISVESANAIIRLQDSRPLSEAEMDEVDHLKSSIAKVRAVRRPITPILISFSTDAGRIMDGRDTRDISQLIEPGGFVNRRPVSFDLSGEGAVPYSTWPKPDTGILVWDPEHTCKITSGLQLFGNVTWWMFWHNGYEPLAALDDNHDGYLEGKELEGLAVWFDRNSNGVSDPGEVIPVQKLGIIRIAVSPSGKSNGVLYNPAGVQFADGRTTATFDWIAEPVVLPSPDFGRSVGDEGISSNRILNALAFIP